MDIEMSCRPGSSFLHADVVGNYKHRPSYPPALFEKLVTAAPARGAVLDIGAGPGKISRALTKSFGSVYAVDPSAEMITVGRAQPGGDASNLVWFQALCGGVPF